MTLQPATAKSDPAQLSAGQEQWPSPGRAWSTVAILILLGVVSMLDRQIINLMAGSIKSDLGLTDLKLSLLQGISFAIFYATLGIPLGYAADRFARRWVIFCGILIWSAAATLSGFASSYGQLLLARIFIGIGEAALAPCAYSMITDLFPARRLGRAISVYSYSSSIGSAVAIAIGGMLLDLSGSLSIIPFFAGMAMWQIGFIVTGAPGLVLAFLVFFIREPKRRGSAGKGQIGSWKDVIAFMKARRRFFACHFTGFSVLMLVCYGMSGWIPIVLMRIFEWGPDQVGLFYALFIMVNSILALTGHGLIVDAMFAHGIHDAHFRYFAFGSVLIIFFGLLATQATSGMFYLLAIAPAFWFINVMGVAAASVQIVTPPHMRGRVSAIFLLVVNLIGLGFGPLVVAAFTTFVFQDESKLMWSIAATMLCGAPIAIAALVAGFGAAREAVASMNSGTAL